MTFWGCILKPGQKSSVNITDSDVLHLSQACLNQPKAGKNNLQVEVEGTSYCLACLEKDKREHETFDLFFDSQGTTFISRGDSEIHLTGYLEPADDDDEGEESEAGEVVTKSAPKVSPKAEPKSSPKVSPKAEAKSSPKAEPASIEGEDDEEEEEEEEESEEQIVPEVKAKLQKAKGKEVTEAKAKAATVESPKRKASSEPQAAAAKKAKNEPPTSPAPGMDEYVQKLVKYLKDNGATSIGLLGSKVPRPAGVPKMKQVFEKNSDKFAVAGDKVSLK